MAGPPCQLFTLRRFCMCFQFVVLVPLLKIYSMPDSYVPDPGKTCTISGYVGTPSSLRIFFHARLRSFQSNPTTLTKKTFSFFLSRSRVDREFMLIDSSWINFNCLTSEIDKRSSSICFVTMRRMKVLLGRVVIHAM